MRWKTMKNKGSHVSGAGSWDPFEYFGVLDLGSYLSVLESGSHFNIC